MGELPRALREKTYAVFLTAAILICYLSESVDERKENDKSAAIAK